MTEEGGLFHDADTLPGTETFLAYGVDGKRIGRWEALAGATDQALIDAFLDFLERREPRARLHIVRRTSKRTRKGRRGTLDNISG